MVLIGYMRVSKADGSQNTDLQRDAQIKAGVDPDHIYEDRASGKKEDRPQLAACLKALCQAPGRVETDFSLVRFKGDQGKAAKVYADKLNLSAADIAESIRWAASQPSHVNIDRIHIMPRDQA